MIAKLFDEIGQGDIESLIENEVPESRSLDYKEQLPKDTSGSKKEFLADISSFANAAGGDLLFGIAESEGIPTEIVGLGDEDLDAAILRLESIIRDGIAPRIPGVQTRKIDGFAAGPILLLRIPKSWASPHMVTYQNTSRFFTRSSAGKHQMDVAEIKAAFLLSESMPERIKNFRLDRISQIMANATPAPLADIPKKVLHIIPLAAFSSDFRLEPEAMRQHYPAYLPIYGSDFSRFNIDGFINIGNLYQEPNIRMGYSQLFRNGVLELVDTGMFLPLIIQEKKIPSQEFEQKLIESVSSFTKALKDLEVPEPAFVMLTLLGCTGYRMGVSPSRTSLRGTTLIDRNVLMCSEVLIEDYEIEAAKAMRPVFDMVWNAAGWPKSLNYNDEGKWSPHR